MTPMLPYSNFDEEQKSVIQSSYMGDKSVIRGRHDTSGMDQHSVVSMPLSQYTRKSNFTMLTLHTKQPDLKSLPKEKNLKEMAE
mmetsp:Transcript_10703/g.10824  ORF Transcript_10703/g.10824 Transcript_10703/m.10824 type:complete len:84 (+) Transcript_10703:145-396(+)